MIRKQEITTFEFPEDAIIWDVRDSSAYAEAHVKGAINQPITELSAQSLTQVSTDQPIYSSFGVGVASSSWGGRIPGGGLASGRSVSG